MIIVDAVDYGTAPEFSTAGPCMIERISAGQVRVTHYSVYRGMDGRPERRVVCHLVWDWTTFLTTIHHTYVEAEPLIEAPPEIGERVELMAH